jgi:signal transduction histidine kinase
MQTLQDISIKKKVVLLIMLAVMTAMSVACTAFVVNDVYMIKHDMAEQFSALAEVLGNSAVLPLRNSDRDAIERLLGSLTIYPAIRSAVVYHDDGTTLATYPAGPSPENLPPAPDKPGYQFRHGHLEVAGAIRDGDRAIGTIYLEGDLAFLRKQMIQYAVIAVAVLVLSCCAAYVFAARLQRVISGPILNLTRTAQEISRNGIFSSRVVKEGNDELGTLCDEFNHMLDQVESAKQELQRANDELEIRVADRTRELSDANQELSREVAERIRAERELESVHREFVDAARRAGMAEIATGVLHNVGNVLNSVNVSVTMVASQLRSSKVKQLSQVVGLLDQHADDLGEFIASDEKGKQVPRFLKVLSESLAKDEESLLEEAESLIANVEHIKAIIATQQTYAKTGEMLEAIDVNTILNDAVRLNSQSYDRHGVCVVQEYADLPPVMIDKQRMMQIVINLVKNAKEALLEQEQNERVLTLRTRTDDDRLIVEVRDTGVGIPKENLTRIFNHGFTTKATGHGFGLHSCANAATEMEGSLSAHSEGPLQGATFVLSLPFRPAAVTV